MAGDVYYSQVNSSLRKELLARSQAGKLNRSPKSIDFMLSKLTNVQIQAFEGDTATTPVIGTLGGGLVTQNSEDGNSYLPGGVNGYATNISTRPGPVITGVTVNVADQGEKGINTATINLVIMDPEQLNEIEDIFFRPGRALKIFIKQSEDVIQNEEGESKLNQDELLYTTKILQQQYEGTDLDLDDFFKMNQLVFTGLVDGFKVEYNIDGTLDVTLSTRSIFGIYTDVSMFIVNPRIPNSSIEAPITETFSDILKGDINNEVERLKKDYPDGFIKQFQILNENDKPKKKSGYVPNSTDRVLMYGPLYKSKDNNKYAYSTMISVGLLIDFLHKYIYLPALEDDTDIDSPIVVPNMQIVCDDRICKTNYYDELVSADPKRILLYQGNTEESKTNTYTPLINKEFGRSSKDTTTNTEITPSDEFNNSIEVNSDSSFFSNTSIFESDITPPTFSPTITNADASFNKEAATTDIHLYEDYDINYYDEITNIDNIPGFYQVSDKDEVDPTLESTKYGCISRILINVETIAEIENKLRLETTKPFNIKNFIKLLCREIRTTLGGAVSPGLIYHPESTSTLLLYDQNYLGPDEQISEFEIPLFSSKGLGTIVRDAKLSYEIPDKYKNLLFGIRSDAISPSKVAAYNPFILANNTNRPSFEERWTKKHEESLKQLKQSKGKLTLDIYDQSYIENLKTALFQYVQYSEPKLKDSINIQKPRYPYSLDFTVDGINGFRFGDVLRFRGIPKKYSDWVFTVDKIVHKLDSKGEWTTNLTCSTRARSRSII